jgi:RHS repeat-associated protein
LSIHGNLRERYRNQSPHILDLVTSRTILEGTSTWMAQTDYVIDDYSTYTLDGTNNGAYGHDTTYGTSKTSRGNVTAVKQYPAQNASPFISYAGFDTLGNTVVSQDAKGRTTSYRFTDSFGTKTTCLPSGATLNAFPDQITNAKNQISKFTYYSCSGKVWKAQDPNDLADTPVRDGTIFVYDNMFRITGTTFPDGGMKSTNYGGSTLPITVTTTQTATPDPSIVSTAIYDGLGRVVQSRLATGTAQGDIITDTTYDPVGHVSTRSNPHYSVASSTDGTTQYQYDSLDRLKQTTKPDGTFTTLQSTGNCVTGTDEAGVQRKTCADARGRLIEVDEAGEGWTSGMAPAGGAGSVTISGTEQSVTQQTGSAAPGSGTLTINGGPQSRLYCPPVGGCYTIWNSGSVYVTVNGLQKSASYGGSSNVSASLASTIASAFNGDVSSSVTASPSSNTITFTAKTSGTSTNYAFSSTSTWNSGQGFTSAAYTVSPSSGNLSGGHDAAYTTTYDSGNVSITVNGFGKSVTFGQASTSDSIATALRNAFNSDTASPVSATGSSGQVTLTSKLTGSATNYALSSSRTWNSGTFAQASFSTSNSGTTLTGGTDGQHNGVFSLSTTYVTYYKYDALDNLLCVEQHGDTSTSVTNCTNPADGIAGGNWRVRKFQYDALARLLQADNPESGRITYAYDSVGNLLTKQSPSPNQPSGTVTINYSPTESPIDALNRVTKKTYSNGDPAIQYSYDETSVAGISGFTNGIGRRTGMTDASGSTVWNYDPAGRTKTERHTIGTITKNVINTYNISGAVISITYPSTRVVSYGHDAAGRTLNATDSNGTQYVSQVTYFPSGAIGTANYGAANGGFTGIAINNSYNNRLQPVALTATAPGPPAVTVMDLHYDFGWGTSDNGNVLSVTNTKSSSRTVNYTYDALNRIHTAVTPNANTWGNTFTVDPWGNLTKMLSYDAQHPEGQHFDQQTDTNNRLIGFGYDSAGNLIQNLSAVYVYDAEGRISSAGGVTYSYDGQGNRVKKSSGTLYWGQTDSGPAAESDSGGNISKEFVSFNGKRCARIDANGAVHYYLSDHLGSSNVVTSASGGVEEESDFYPYGGERIITDTLSDQNYKFTGKERDTESGLDYFVARYYGSNLGRFMTPDPLLTTLRSENPQTLNRYAYTLNNPLRYTDPTGAYEEDVHEQLTTVLAQAAGFDENTASQIGRADQGVDEDSKTGPFASTEARRDYHFTSEERRNELWSAFDSSGSIKDLGTYLHAEQDSYSHEGYGPRLGHLSAGHAPDKTYNDPAKADRMAKDTYTKLSAAADRLGIKGNKVAFAKIDKLVSAFNKAKTTEEKNKILGQIKDVIKQAQKEQQPKKKKKERQE